MVSASDYAVNASGNFCALCVCAPSYEQEPPQAVVLQSQPSRPQSQQLTSAGMSKAEAPRKVDVLVVGAGPVGLMLAVLCERWVHDMCIYRCICNIPFLCPNMELIMHRTPSVNSKFTGALEVRVPPNDASRKKSLRLALPADQSE